MDTSHAHPTASPPDALTPAAFPQGRQHGAAPWTPAGAPARYDVGGERHTPPSALTPPAARTAPPPSAPAPPPVAPGPVGQASTAPAGAGAGRGSPAPRAAERAVPDVGPVAATPAADGVPAGRQSGTEVPWAFQRQAHWEMPAQPRSVPAARHCAALLLASWGVYGEDVEQVVLLVSELTTNSTLHGRRDMSVDLTLAGSHVDLTVSDYGPVVGRGEKLPADESGRGLEIVSALADGLHVQRHRTGTNAWASYRLAASRYR
ncbi:ATP-binding protein [Streptacidiphilus sp. P02-A3a]|uniref:ATP-binding protein n=1 Tax=Streptacidiphilus sp. P02-A3a TaxID=2704468 RepID=UPI0015FD2462|nr:ATP-binding protein [Streptacidiphilus sp. P02-A3a]QMU71043.1 ATP-binding protein [Streptacidiphilus sp. P02-A3a]